MNSTLFICSSSLFSSETLVGSSPDTGRAALPEGGECEELSWDTPSVYYTAALIGLNTTGRVTTLNPFPDCRVSEAIIKITLGYPGIPSRTIQTVLTLLTKMLPAPLLGASIALDYVLCHSPQLLSAFLNLTQSKDFSSPASLQNAFSNTVSSDPTSPPSPSPSLALISQGPD